MSTIVAVCSSSRSLRLAVIATLTPAESRPRGHLIKRSGESWPGGQGVTTADNDQTRPSCIFTHQPIVRVQAEECPPAAVHVHQCGTQRRRTLRAPRVI